MRKLFEKKIVLYSKICIIKYGEGKGEGKGKGNPATGLGFPRGSG